MSRNTAVGNGYAREVAEFLAELLPGVERRVNGSTRDRGDLAGLDVDGFTAELKREAKLDIAGALFEAELEAGHAGTPWFVAICYRRRGKGCPGGARYSYATTPLWIFRELLAEGRRLRARVAELEAVLRELRRYEAWAEPFERTRADPAGCGCPECQARGEAP